MRSLPISIRRTTTPLYYKTQNLLETIHDMTPKCLKTDDGLAYDSLVKDSPLIHFSPVVVIDGGSDWISIELAKSAPDDYDERNPLNVLGQLADQVNLFNPFHLTARFDVGYWDPEIGFRRLGEYIAWLAKRYIEPRHWETLTIKLPLDVNLPYCDALIEPFPLEMLAYIRTLKWKGHPMQMKFSWLPMLPVVLENLTTLSITCREMAGEDCFYLIFHAARANEITLKTYKTYRDPIFSFPLPDHPISRPRLLRLTLKTEDNVITLLKPFKFPSLTCLSLDLRHYRTEKTFQKLDPQFWRMIKGIHILSDLPLSDQRWIKSHCHRSATVIFVNNRPSEIAGELPEYLHRRAGESDAKWKARLDTAWEIGAAATRRTAMRAPPMRKTVARPREQFPLTLSQACLQDQADPGPLIVHDLVQDGFLDRGLQSS